MARERDRKRKKAEYQSTKNRETVKGRKKMTQSEIVTKDREERGR